MKRGDIVDIDLGLPPNQIKGHEQGYTRPCVVIKPMDALKLAVILPITGTENSYMHYTTVELKAGTGGLTKDSFVLCHQIRTVSIDRLIKKRGTASPRDLSKIISVLKDTLEI